jgi:hypothetical protein
MGNVPSNKLDYSTTTLARLHEHHFRDAVLCAVIPMIIASSCMVGLLVSLQPVLIVVGAATLFFMPYVVICGAVDLKEYAAIERQFPTISRFGLRRRVFWGIVLLALNVPVATVCVYFGAIVLRRLID